MANLLATQGLSLSYSKEQYIRFPDLLLKPGEHTLLLGASGSGKTSWLHLLGGLRKPNEGRVLYGEEDLYQMKGTQRDRFRGSKIGLVFQQPHLVQALNVLDNVRLAAKMARLPWDIAKASALFGALGIDHLTLRNVRTLSGGEAQRVALARALITNPSVLLADEPTASLDDDNCAQVMQLLLTSAEQHNATLIVATHDHRVKSHFEHEITLAAS